MPVDLLQARLVFLVAAVGVLVLAREPIRQPEKPGSRGFLVAVLSISVWLATAGLSFFVPDFRGTLVLYNLMLSSVLGVFLGYIVLAVEYSTQRLVSRRFLYAMGAIAAVHVLVLWTNFVWLHEIMYGADSSVENAIMMPERGPGFWVHTFAIQALIVLSIALFAKEVVTSSGLRRRQAAVLLSAPLPGLLTNGVWLFGSHGLSWDPTPFGVMAGVGILGWALYRTNFLEIVPVARATVVEQMSDAVVTLDDQQRVLDWNREARERLGVEEPEVGMSADAFFEQVPDATVRELATSGETERRVAFEVDGRERHFSVLVSASDVGAAEDGRVLVFREVTAARERERQLVEQNETLESFADIVSDDIQGPLGEIRTNARRAVEDGDPSTAEDVLDAVDRVDRRIDDLLELARVGRRIDDPEPAAIGDVATEAWRRVWSVDAELTVEDDRTILADPGRLQQCFELLFRNALEHAGEEVSVTVGAVEEGFYVEDDGPGIPSEDRQLVFERGYADGEDGAGIGLAVVQQIALAHGWFVRATEGEAGGARIEFGGVDAAS